MKQAALGLTLLTIGSLSLIACEKKSTDIETSVPAPSSAPSKQMHPSWDADGNGVNDCETNGSCDDSIDYTQPRPAPVATPAFDCTQTTEDSIQHLICQEPALAQLDQILANTIAAAKENASNMQLSLLKAEQPEWHAQLEGCKNDDDQITCLKWHYERRIAELQVRHELVPSNGPFRFHCGNTDIIITFYQSTPQTLVAIRDEEGSLMYIAPSASGSKYESDNESFWEHQGEARIIWGPDTQELTCTKAD